MVNKNVEKDGHDGAIGSVGLDVVGNVMLADKFGPHINDSVRPVHLGDGEIYVRSDMFHME